MMPHGRPQAALHQEQVRLINISIQVPCTNLYVIIINNISSKQYTVQLKNNDNDDDY